MKKIVKIFFREGYIIPILCSAVLIFTCIFISGQKYMWYDEISTYSSSSLHSFGRMISFATDSINCGNYLHIILAWFWAQIFSASELSLRLFSSIGFCIGMLMTWVTLRKVYGLWSASFATVIVFLSSVIIIFENANARFYGMLFALIASLFYITIKNLDNKHFNIKTALSLFFINGFLPLTHLFGFAYSLLFIFATIIIDAKKKSLRWWYYISSFAGWLLFIPFIPAFQKALELGKPHFWVTIPNINQLISLYTDERTIFISFLVVIIGAFFCKFTTKFYYKEKIKDTPILFLGTLFLLFPIFIWIYSQFFPPLFWPRYVIIFELGFIIFIAAITARILPKDEQLNSIQKIILMGVIAILFILPIKRTINMDKNIINDKQQENESKIAEPGLNDFDLPSGIPIVTDNAHIYLPRFYYNPLGKEYYLVVDWGIAISPNQHLALTQDFKAMLALKKQIPEQHIMTTKEFLDTFSKFVLFDDDNNWFKIRIKNNPEFNVTKIKPYTYLVERKDLIKK